MISTAKILICSLLMQAVVEACSCGRTPTTCELLASAKVAFVGTVRQGTGPDDPNKPGAGFGIGGKPAIVSVETNIRGLPEGTLEIQVDPSIGTSCYLELKAGERWLLFGSLLENGGKRVVYTGGCTGSISISPADPRGIQRMVASYAGGSEPAVRNFVFGEVRKYKGWNTRWRDDNLIAGAEVSLTPAGPEAAGAKGWKGTTATNGRFEVEGLSPGVYQFAAAKGDLGSELMSRETFRDYGDALPVKVEVPAKGCLELPVLLREQTRISGRVRSSGAVAGAESGKPVPKVTVTAFEAPSDSDGRPRAVRSAVTDEEGRYEITRIPAGTYVVAVNAERGEDSSEYPMTFHPASPSQHGAARVEIGGSSATAEGIDITLPGKRKLVTMQVRVVWPDGRPVPEAIVDVADSQNERIYRFGERRAGREDWARFTDANGYASITVYDGTEYTVSATWQLMETPPRGSRVVTGRTIAWHRTNEAKVRVAGVGDEVVRLILNEKPDENPFRLRR